MINRDAYEFADNVVYGVATKGMKWEDIVLRFEWSFEKESIAKFIEENTFLGE